MIAQRLFERLMLIFSTSFVTEKINMLIFSTSFVTEKINMTSFFQENPSQIRHCPACFCGNVNVPCDHCTFLEMINRIDEFL